MGEEEYSCAMNVLSDRSRESLLKAIHRRMTPQPIKIRADVELTCFESAGVEAIKEAMRAGEAVSKNSSQGEDTESNEKNDQGKEEDEEGVEVKFKEEQPEVKVKLVAPPLYVLTTQVK